MKRIVSAVLMLCLFISLISTSYAAEQSFIVNGVTISASSGTALSNCSTYAGQVLSKIWNYHGVTTTFKSNYNILQSKSAAERTITEEHVRDYIQKAPVGSRIRITHYGSESKDNYDANKYGHTMVLVAKNDAANTFTTLEAGWGNSEARTYTYQSFVNKWTNYEKDNIIGYRYFFYIADLTPMGPPNTANNTQKYYLDLNASLDGDQKANIEGFGTADVYINGQLVSSNCTDYWTAWPTGTKYEIKITPASGYTLKGICEGNDIGTIGTKNVDVRPYFSPKAKDNSTLSINLTNYPTGTLKQGTPFTLQGSVTSNYKITKIYAEICDIEGAVSSSSTETPNRTSYPSTGGKFAKDLQFENLQPDRYVLIIHAEDEFGNSKDWTGEFSVTAAQAANRPTETKPTYYTVTYDANGGSVSPTSMRFTAGDDIDNMPTPTRNGYTFIGWSPAKNPTGSAYIVTSGAMTVDEDLTLYAQWKADTSTTTETWGPWSEWSIVQWASSPTRQVEKKETKISDAYTEYRYGRYVDSTGKHDCWCEKYFRSLGYAAVGLQHSEWSTTRYPVIDTGWTCGYCGGHHIGAASTSGGKSYWNEYGLPDGSYYWEESRTVPANVQTLYRYRDLQ